MNRRIRGVLIVAALSALGPGSAMATAAPTASPSVNRTFVGMDPGTQCRYGYLCAYVRGDGGYYRFDFSRCNTRYRLSGWHGRGYMVNSQYGGVRARFYTRSGALYASRRSRGASSIDWQPVWSLVVC